jgi:HK97 family phage prohead protease
MTKHLLVDGEIELRAFAECRAESDDGKKIRGYAIVFNSLSHDLGGFREIIAPEAVDRTLKDGADVRALVDHNPEKVIGRTRSGTLELRKDRKGLHTVIEPDPGISYASDIMRAVARGDVSGMSFRFRVPAGGASWDDDAEGPIRTVHDMRISEVSIVTFPAYEATDVQVALRSLDEFRASQRRSLSYLRRWHKTQLAK